MTDGLAEAPLAPPRNENAGHRDRLRARYREVGSEGLSHHELVELLLFQFVPRSDTKATAKALIERFGNLEGVLMAPAKELQTVSGVGPKVAEALSVLADIHRRALEDRFRKKTVLSSWQAVIEYLYAQMAFLHREQFRVLFLDKRHGLIANEAMQEGTVDHTPAYPREVIRRAIELSATAVILVHNHPSGDPTPSRADVEMTKQIIEAGQPLDIKVYDHIIIARDAPGGRMHASLKGLQLI